MPGQYVLNAVRTLWSRKLDAAINVLGLATGLACCLMIVLFVRYEFSYDGFFAEANNIYRLSPDYPATANAPERRLIGNAGLLAPLIRDSGHDAIRDVARIAPLQISVVGDELVAQERVYFADAAFFRMFDLEWIHGSADTAFERPNSIVITQSQAQRFFGNRSPFGKTLRLDDRNEVTVWGVIADIPENSHFANGMFLPIEFLSRQTPFSADNWNFTNFHTYLLLEPDAEIARVVDDVSRLVANALEGSNTPVPRFTPYALTDIHMQEDRTGALKTPGNPLVVAAYAAIAAALLAIACINYVNLATARTSWRAREIGIRKTAGAARHELFGQFLGESFVLVGIALVFALALTELLLPVFGSIVGRHLDFAELARPELLLLTTGIATLTALAAGSYPALWLSGFKPAHVLRSNDGVPAGAALRNALVVLQFTLAIALVAATLVIYLQMNFVRDMDPGFTRNAVVVLRGTKEKGLGRQWSLLKRELLNHPNVVAITEGTLFPGATGQRKVRVENGAGTGVDMANVMGGYEFLQAYAISLVAGRYFDEQQASDTLTLPGLTTASELRGSYVLSESAVRALGMGPEEALGRRLEMDFSRDFSMAVPGPVIGVVEDIHPYSLHEPPRPMVFFVPESSPGAFATTQPAPMPGQLAIFDQASVVLGNGDTAATLAWIRERWRMFTPDVPLMHEFLDARYAALYRQEEQQARLFTFFAVLTTVVACLGLFGLSSFIVEKRFREIGIRKVMGSSVWQIVRLLTCDFSKLVLLANLIAWPVTYVAMERWLQTFAYRIDLTPMIFIGSGLITLCVAWVTVGGTAAKAAAQKPVLALRYG